MSIQERKLCPQFQVAHVMGGLIKDSNNESTVRINVAPDTWATRSALRRGKAIWDKMVREGTEGLSLAQIKPKYHDYKVLLNSVMTLTPEISRDADGHSLPSGDWNYSTYHSEDIDWTNANLLTDSNRQADSFEAHIVGQHDGPSTNFERISLMRSWIDSRPEPDTNTPDVPAAITADPLANLFDESDASDEIIEMIRGYNDGPPYDFNSTFGVDQPNAVHNNLQRVSMAATQTGAGQIAALNGFSAICGLLEVHITQGVGSGEVEMILDVAMKGGKI